MQDKETSDQGASTYISPADLRDARAAPATRRKYESCRNVIKGWIKGDLAKEEEKLKRDGKRFLDDSGEIIGTQFTPAYFDEFLARKRTSVTVSTLNGYRSAMLDLYNRQRVPLPDDYDQDMAYLFSGMQREQTTHDQTSGAGTSGKEPLPYSLYKELCEKTLVRSDGGLMHLYLTAQWNLTCRSASVETLCTQHLSSADNNISAVFYKTKTDQEGKRPKHPRHMYANPANPATCVITALAVYLACHSTLAAGSLFPGNDQKSRFSGALRKYFGGKRKKTPFGTHSIRKGSASFACGGSTCGPSLSAVCNRCDWSLGTVLDRYLRYEQAGDQYMGRLVAGLPQNSAAFAALPPHFDNDDDDVINATRNMFPSLAKNDSILLVLKLCLASLTYHAGFLQSTLLATHPLRSCSLFRDRNLLERLEAKVAMESDWMRPTGIPPYVEMFAKLEETQHIVERLPDMLFDGIGKIMDDRHVGGSNLTKAVLQDTLRSILQETGVHESQTPEAPPATSLAPITTQEMHWWDNGVHFLPDDFNFPKIDPLGAWKHWWFGNESLRNPPYAAINPKDLRKEVRNTFYEWRRFMKRIITEIQKTTKTPVPRIRSELQAERLFNIGMSTIPLKQSSRKRRCAQLTLTTTLRLAREAKYESNPDYCPKAFVPRKKKTAGSTICHEVTTSRTI